MNDEKSFEIGKVELNESDILNYCDKHAGEDYPQYILDLKFFIARIVDVKIRDIADQLHHHKPSRVGNKKRKTISFRNSKEPLSAAEKREQLKDELFKYNDLIKSLENIIYRYEGCIERDERIDKKNFPDHKKLSEYVDIIKEKLMKEDGSKSSRGYLKMAEQYCINNCTVNSKKPDKKKLHTACNK